MNPTPASDSNLLRRIRWLVALFILGLVLSGATAIPIETEVDWLVKFTGARQLIEGPGSTNPPAWAEWLCRVQTALHETNLKFPFIGYGGDWLAFGHFMIALVFIGAWRDPVRNNWLFDFGLIACALVIPYALIFGGVRGIPIWWRLIDCAFGVFGAVPLWICKRDVRALEAAAARSYFAGG
jgi:hypothetical protein